LNKNISHVTTSLISGALPCQSQCAVGTVASGQRAAMTKVRKHIKFINMFFA